jgi:ribosome-associated protein
VLEPLAVTDSIVIPGADLTFAAARASGPGGQNVNKVASKVELRFDLPGTRCLDDDVKARLRVLAHTRLDADGWLLVRSQRTRDQPKNLADAREKLRALVLAALVPPTPRKATKPSRGVRERRLSDKHHDGVKKRERRRGSDEG